LHELIAQLENIAGRKIPVLYGDWRSGDQKVFVADISLLEERLGWKPRVSPDEGVKKLFDWVCKNLVLFQ
jgi:CDP-paratose 2-epimerase